MRAFTIKLSDVHACPIKSLLPSHYREDGSCLHHPQRWIDFAKTDEFAIEEARKKAQTHSTGEVANAADNHHPALPVHMPNRSDDHRS